MEKLTFLLHIVVFIACAYPSSSSTLLNDRSFEISNLPSSRAEKLIRELNLFPKLDVNVIDVTDSTLASAEEEVPSIVERSFRFPNIISDGGATGEGFLSFFQQIVFSRENVGKFDLNDWRV
ncbi:hypothetical protein Bca52824_018602 [Brassica carinata]|uniref:Uncharacterized protein n=1 Tax=Brassica carinata TaxID=52824 RepID=A0A8X7VR79_BRACI|nr:hypothetical protein Bca52824_018602 [Brassica carinata]